jgi:outer membrane lipoprotein LolB
LRWVALGLTLLLGACASQPPEPAPAAAGEWEALRASLAALDQWQVRGKVGFRSPDTSESASLSWDQYGDNSLINLSGPMGVNSVTIRSDGRQLEIKSKGEPEAWDRMSPEMVSARTGWELPLQALPYWMKGIPAPGDIQNLAVEGGVLRLLQQQDWQVEYRDHGTFGRYRLPTQVAIRREDTRVNLILREWVPRSP